MSDQEFEAVIGLEVHAQLSTNSKLFSPMAAKPAPGISVSDVSMNEFVDVVCSAQPGSLPVINRTSIEYAIKAGIATNCSIREKSVFSRKHYFYPDLPKGYQISQYDLPICENGFLEISTKEGAKKITIQRIHMEEDAGKNMHMSGYSLINLNRAGVPLIEIVSGPDLRSSEEAVSYLKALHAVVTYIDVCDGNMQEGNFRCDANVSVRPRGTEKLGTRCEIKNVNSFRFVEKAIEFEIARQIEVIKAGGKVSQETRGYDSAKNTTFTMRSKEEAQDYRYFPDPDLLPLVVESSWVEKVRSSMPELPSQKKNRFMQELKLSDYDAGVLTQSKEVANFYEDALSHFDSKNQETAKLVANLLSSEVMRLMNEEEKEIKQSKLTSKHLSDAAKEYQAQTLSSSAAKQVLSEAWKTGEGVSSLIEKLGLKQVSDASSLEPLIDEIMKENPKQLSEYRAGKEKLFGFFVGQVMKKSQGKANPVLTQELLTKKLKG